MEHTWSITNLKRIETSGMVTEVSYQCRTQHTVPGLKHPAGHTINGKLTLTTGSVSDPSFVSYENLTEGTVLGWITSSLDLQGIELGVSASIAERIRLHYERVLPPTHAEGTPW